MLSCHEATRLMSEAQDRALTMGERLSLRTHLLICRGCRNFEDNLRSLRVIARVFARGSRTNAEGPGTD